MGPGESWSGRHARKNSTLPLSHALALRSLKYFVGLHRCPFVLRGKLAFHLVPVAAPVGVATSLMGADSNDASCLLGH